MSRLQSTGSYCEGWSHQTYKTPFLGPSHKGLLFTYRHYSLSNWFVTAPASLMRGRQRGRTWHEGWKGGRQGEKTGTHGVCVGGLCWTCTTWSGAPDLPIKKRPEGSMFLSPPGPNADCPSCRPARGLARGPDSWPLASALALSLPSSAEIAGPWST